MKPSGKLPAQLRGYFWDTNFDAVSWDLHYGYIVRRLISVGPKSVAWLRGAIGDGAIRDELVRRRARGFTYPQIARWVSRETYDDWTGGDPNRHLWITGTL